MKSGRNDPCPCGSGKKYKHCCLGQDNIIPFPGSAYEEFAGPSFQHDQMMEMLLGSTGFSSPEELDSAMKRYEQFCESRDEGPYPTFMEFLGRGNQASLQTHKTRKDLAGMDFASLEEANEYLKEYSAIQNNSPLEEFLGLSPEQMQKILAYEIWENDVLVQVNRGIENNDVSQTQIVRLSFFLLHMLRDAGGVLPLTSTGNMKREHCTIFWKFLRGLSGWKGFQISSEDRLPELSGLRYMLEETGYIERLKTRIRLSPQGSEVLNSLKGQRALYLHLLDFYTESFDWLGDYYFHDSCSIIQDTALFSLYVLHKKAGRFIHQDELYKFFHIAFPMIDDIPVLPSGISIMPEVYEILFLDHFCRFFGLVERRNAENDRKKWLYKTTALFDKLFEWLV